MLGNCSNQMKLIVKLPLGMKILNQKELPI